MAKIVFPGIAWTPADRTIGVAPIQKPVARIPHVAGTGANGIPEDKMAKPVVTGANSIATAAGALTDLNGLNGKVYRISEAVDIAGNNAPNAAPIVCTVTDVTPTNIYPIPQYTLVQFDPTIPRKTSQHYEQEIEEELEYILYPKPAAGGGDVS